MDERTPQNKNNNSNNNIYIYIYIYILYMYILYTIYKDFAKQRYNTPYACNVI